MTTREPRPHRLSRPWQVLLIGLSLVAANSGCSETREALAYGRFMRSNTIDLAHKYLDAASRSDSAALAHVTTDSLFARLGGGRSYTQPERERMRHVRDTFRPRRMRLDACGADLYFTFEEHGERQDGLVEARFVEGELRVSKMFTELVIN